MPEKLIAPKFLTIGFAKFAVRQVLATAMDPFGSLLKRKACHVVIVVPAMRNCEKADSEWWSQHQIFPQILYEHSVGDKKKWTGKYDEIARGKAHQLWHERNDDRSDIIPHLLFPGDPPYWGGVKRHGIVVTCSGVQPWFDKMIAGMIADMLIALAYNAWMTSDDKKNGVDWLT